MSTDWEFLPGVDKSTAKIIHLESPLKMEKNDMRKIIEPSDWQTNLAEFGERNKMRSTRLEVLGAARDVEFSGLKMGCYWQESLWRWKEIAALP